MNSIYTGLPFNRNNNDFVFQEDTETNSRTVNLCRKIEYMKNKLTNESTPLYKNACNIIFSLELCNAYPFPDQIIKNAKEIKRDLKLELHISEPIQFYKRQKVDEIEKVDTDEEYEMEEEEEGEKEKEAAPPPKSALSYILDGEITEESSPLVCLLDSEPPFTFDRKLLTSSITKISTCGDKILILRKSSTIEEWSSQKNTLTDHIYFEGYKFQTMDVSPNYIYTPFEIKNSTNGVGIYPRSDKTIKKNFQSLLTSDIDPSFYSSVRTIQSFSDKFLAVGFQSSDLAIFDIEKMNRVALWNGRPRPIYSLCVDATSTFLGAAGSFNRFVIYSLRNYELRPQQLATDRFTILSTYLSKGCQRALAGDKKGNIRLWNVETTQKIMQFPTEIPDLNHIISLDDYVFYFSGRSDIYLRWDTRTNKLINIKPLKDPAKITAMAATGHHLIIGTEKGDVYPFDTHIMNSLPIPSKE